MQPTRQRLGLSRLCLSRLGGGRPRAPYLLRSVGSVLPIARQTWLLTRSLFSPGEDVLAVGCITSIRARQNVPSDPPGCRLRDSVCIGRSRCRRIQSACLPSSWTGPRQPSRAKKAEGLCRSCWRGWHPVCAGTQLRAFSGFRALTAPSNAASIEVDCPS